MYPALADCMGRAGASKPPRRPGMKTRRQYDEEFKKMAVDLLDVKVAAQELGITPQTLTR